jgi:hypothetical protein
MTVYLTLLTMPQGRYDMNTESGILYASEGNMIFMAVDEREHPGIQEPDKRDNVVSVLWREYVQKRDHVGYDLTRIRGATIQVVPHNKLAALLTKQGEYADATGY